MAALTWRNVDAPDFSASSRMQEAAGRAWSDASTTLQGAIGRMRDEQRERSSNEFIAGVMANRDAGSWDEALRSGAAFAGRDVGSLDSRALEFAGNHASQLLGEADRRSMISSRQASDRRQDEMHPLDMLWRQAGIADTHSSINSRDAASGRANDLHPYSLATSQQGLVRGGIENGKAGFELGSLLSPSTSAETATRLAGSASAAVSQGLVSAAEGRVILHREVAGRPDEKAIMANYDELHETSAESTRDVTVNEALASEVGSQIRNTVGEIDAQSARDPDLAFRYALAAIGGDIPAASGGALINTPVSESEIAAALGGEYASVPQAAQPAPQGDPIPLVSPERNPQQLIADALRTQADAPLLLPVGAPAGGAGERVRSDGSSEVGFDAGRFAQAPTPRATSIDEAAPAQMPTASAGGGDAGQLANDMLARSLVDQAQNPRAILDNLMANPPAPEDMPDDAEVIKDVAEATGIDINTVRKSFNALGSEMPTYVKQRVMRMNAGFEKGNWLLNQTWFGGSYLDPKFLSDMRAEFSDLNAQGGRITTSQRQQGDREAVQAIADRQRQAQATVDDLNGRLDAATRRSELDPTPQNLRAVEMLEEAVAKAERQIEDRSKTDFDRLVEIQQSGNLTPHSNSRASTRR